MLYSLQYVTIVEGVWCCLTANVVERAERLNGREARKVEIPTYTEYIPPKPILDEKEKEWFDFIKPFRNTIKYIEKRECIGKEYARIQIIANGDVISFPAFYRDRMYKGMELDKEYSLEELGL